MLLMGSTVSMELVYFATGVAPMGRLMDRCECPIHKSESDLFRVYKLRGKYYAHNAEASMALRVQTKLAMNFLHWLVLVSPATAHHGPYMILILILGPSLLLIPMLAPWPWRLCKPWQTWVTSGV